MLIIRTYAALSDASAVFAGNEVHTLLEAHVERLADYADFDLTDLAMFAIVCPRDTMDSIEQDLGRPLIDSAGTFIQPVEIIARHGGWYEATFILSDDGFGLILLVPIDDLTEPRLLAACKRALEDQLSGG